MKLFVVFTAAVALVGATQVQQPVPGYGILNAQGRVIGNEILRTSRRVFSSRGGWGSPSGGEPSGYRPGPPPPGLDGSLMNLFNAMSSFGLSSNYGAPGSGGSGRPPSSSYGPPSGTGGSGASRPPSSEYGVPPPPGSGGAGRPPSSQYGPPPASGGNGGSGPSSQYGPPASGGGGAGSGGYSQGGAGAVGTRGRGTGGAPSGRTTANPGGAGGAQPTAPDGGRIFRYVSLFTAPDEPPPPARKIVRAGPSTPDKHVNIIFVKPPAPAAEQPTEVVLSAEPQRKTIVYVLMKKPVEGQETVRVRPAPPTQPSKPEVYFIPYTDPSGQKPGGGESGNGDNGQGGYGDGGNGGNGGSGSGDQSGGYNNGPSGGYDNGPATGGPSAPPSGGYNNGGSSGPSAPSGGYNNGGSGSNNGLVYMGLSAPGGYD